MHALELYMQDKAARRNSLPRQEYYNALLDALHAELMQDGRSDWLDALAADLEAGTMADMYLLDFAAVMACHEMLVRGLPLRDASRYVPYTRSAEGERLAWSDMRPGGGYRMRLPDNMKKNLSELRLVAEKLPDGLEDPVAPPPERVANRHLEQSQILNRHLEQQNAALIAERNELRRRLAELQEGYISETLQFACEARRREMEAELEAQFAAERDQAAEAFRRQYQKELLTLEGRRFEADRLGPTFVSGVQEEYRAIRAEMQGQLQRLQAHIDGQLAGWERSLFRAESRMLAQSFVSLCALNGSTLLPLLTEAQAQASPLMPQLARLQSDFHTRLMQLEQAMVRLGLTVVRPAPGAPYDPGCHTLTGVADAAVPPAGTPIRSCVLPGVLLTREEGAAPEVLVPAEVTLDAPTHT